MPAHEDPDSTVEVVPIPLPDPDDDDNDDDGIPDDQEHPDQEHGEG